MYRNNQLLITYLSKLNLHSDKKYKILGLKCRQIRLFDKQIRGGCIQIRCTTYLNTSIMCTNTFGMQTNTWADVFGQVRDLLVWMPDVLAGQADVYGGEKYVLGRVADVMSGIKNVLEGVVDVIGGVHYVLAPYEASMEDRLLRI